MLRLMGCLAAAGLLLGGCGAKVKCDDAKIAELTQPALDGMPPAKRADFAVKLLTELCSEPAGLREAFSTWPQIPPDQRPPTIGRAAADNGGLWKKGCPGGRDTFDALARAPMEQRGPILFEGCNLSRFEGVTADNLNLDTAMIGILYAPVLEKSQAPAADKARILNALLVR